MTPLPHRPHAPTGRREAREGHDSVVFDRTFPAPIQSVWAAVTESERLERWIGVWSGDPTSGSVQFRMNAEGDAVQPETFTIDACEPPRRLALTSSAQDDQSNVDQTEGEQVRWRYLLVLTEDAGTTTLTFSQSLTDPETAASMGPGWDYYLDRLVAAETGADVGAIDFGDYYPAVSEHYRTLFS